jgi:hypothetical protein
MKIGENIEKPKIRKTLFNKERIVTKLAEMSSSNKYAIELMKDLPEMFEYSALKDKINEALNEGVIGEEKRIMLEDLQWLVDSFYTLEFKHDHDITERVIFPMSNSESRGIEDFFVRFTDDDGSEKCLQLIPL